MKFRYHRGGYEDSMSTEIIVNSKAELLQHINAGRHIQKIEDVTFEHIGVDPRNGWNTHYVLLIGGGVIGMSDGILE